ncbi:MAG: chemotaxis protein CheW [Nitrospirales bacterium]
MHCSTSISPIISSGYSLIFNRHRTRYALPLSSVKEIICLPELVARDNMPDHIVGVFNYHGQWVPVMNLDSPLGHVSFRYKISDNVILFEWDGFICGLIVDDARDLLDIQPEQMEMESPPEIESGQPHPFIAHLVPHDDGVIHVMHPLPIPQDRNAIRDFMQTLSESGQDGQLSHAPHLIRGMTLLEQTLLRERTTNLMESDQEDLSEYTQLVVIRINQEYFGIDLGLIRECAEFRQVTPIPGCPDFVLGVINVRGEVLPIVDMRATLNVPTDESENFHKAVVVQFENIFVGIVAEEIIESVFLQASDMVSGSLTGSGKEKGYIRGIAQFHDQKFLKVLDLQKLLMNGEVTVDQTFSQVPSDQQQPVSEESAEPAVSEGNELQAIFMRESKESLRDLRESIVNLRETLGDSTENPEDFGQVTLQRAFNQSHFLMSVARMLGARKMEIVARRVEDLLRVVKRGQNVLTLEIIDYLDHGVNGVQALLDEFMRGATTEIDPLDFLDGSALVEAGISLEPVKGRLEEEVIAGDHGRGLLVESIRLDGLMELVNELKTIISGRQECLVDTTHLVEFSDSWSQKVFEHRAIGVKGHRSKQLLTRDIMTEFYKQESQQLSVLTSVVGRVARTITDEHQRLSSISEALDEHIRSMRLLTFSSFFQHLPKMASDIGRELRKEIELSIEGGHMTVDMHVLEELKEPLRQLIRNAIHHGIESPRERIQAGKPQKGALRLYVFQMGTYLLLELWDDGKGLDLEGIKRTAVKDQLFTNEELEAMPLPQIESLVFKPGFSTEPSRRGVVEKGMGLDVVQSAVKRLKGAVYVGSTPGSGCMIQVQLPGPMPPVHLLIISVAGQRYGIPIDHVQTTTHLPFTGSKTSKHQEFVGEDGQVVPVVSLAGILEVEEQFKQNELCPCVVIVVDGKPLGCFVDAILSEQEVRPQPQGLILKRVRHVSGATILNTGEVCLILNSDDLIRTAQKHFPISLSS